MTEEELKKIKAIENSNLDNEIKEAIMLLIARQEYLEKSVELIGSYLNSLTQFLEAEFTKRNI